MAFSRMALLAVLLAALQHVVRAQTCQKDAGEDCNIFHCGRHLNARCVKNGNNNECMCPDGSCAVPEEEGGPLLANPARSIRQAVSSGLTCQTQPSCAAHSR